MCISMFHIMIHNIILQYTKYILYISCLVISFKGTGQIEVTNEPTTDNSNRHESICLVELMAFQQVKLKVETEIKIAMEIEMVILPGNPPHKQALHLRSCNFPIFQMAHLIPNNPLPDSVQI